MQDEPNPSLLRQWTMLRAIPRWPQSITVATLLQILHDRNFKTVRRTVERELHEMINRFPLYLDNSRRPYRWSWMKNAGLEFLPGLSVSQCLALVLARAHITHLMPKWMLDDLAPLFDAAERELAKTEWKDWHKRTAVVPLAFVLQPPKIDPKVLDDVMRAATRRLCLTATYRSIGKQPARRTIHPLGLLTRGTVQYLVCLLPEYEKPRQLALHRMSDTVITTERCKELHGFSMRRYVDKDLPIDSRGKIRVRCLFTDTAADHLRGTPMSKYQSWHPIEGTGKVEVCATVDDDKQFMRWVLSFGSEMKVLEPEHLRNEIAEELRKAAAMYAQP